MKIGLRGGHSPNCIGAIGLRKEYESMQSLYYYVKECLENNGHKVIDCNSKASTQNQELAHGVNTANNNNVDLFISLHMNKYNSKAHGTECWICNHSSVTDMANRICERLSKDIGFFNRGVKYSNTMYEMRYTNMPNIIIEVCFCDSEKDISIWSPTPYEDLALAICKGIDPKIENYQGNKSKKYQVRYYTFSNKQDAENFVEKVKKVSSAWYTIEEM